MEWSTVAIFLVIIFLIAGGLAFYKSLMGPVGDALKDLLGAVDAASKIFEAEINSCKSAGWNPFRGCIITLIPTIIGAFQVLMMIGRVINSFLKRPIGQNPTAKEVGDYLKQELGKDAVTTDDVNRAKEVQEEVEQKGGSDEAQRAAARESFQRTGLKRAQEQIARNPSPEARQEFNQTIDIEMKEFARQRQSLDPEDQHAIDNADNMPDEPRPFPP